jgi:hypothetical protein
MPFFSRCRASTRVMFRSTWRHLKPARDFHLPPVSLKSYSVVFKESRLSQQCVYSVRFGETGLNLNPLREILDLNFDCVYIGINTIRDPAVPPVGSGRDVDAQASAERSMKQAIISARIHKTNNLLTTHPIEQS